MKHLITGATGFLGLHLIDELKRFCPNDTVFTMGLGTQPANLKGHLTCDMTDENAVDKIVSSVRPDFVYHLVGASKITTEWTYEDYFSRNFLTTVALANAVDRLQQKCKLFFASSVHVYGNQPNLISELSPVSPISPYGHTKLLAEEALRDLTKRNSKINVVVGRLYSCLGPGQPTGFVAGDLCRKVAKLPQKGGTLKTGPLHGIRRFIDARDMVKTFPRFLSKVTEPTFDVFNIASPHELEVRDVVNLIIKVSGKNVFLESSQDTSVNPFMGLRISIEKLGKTLPEVHFRPIEETLKDMYDWVVANPDC